MWILGCIFALLPVIHCDINANIFGGHDMILKPPTPLLNESKISDLPNRVLIFAQGVQINADSYKPMLESIQEYVSPLMNLWIGVPYIPFDVTITQVQFERAVADLADRIAEQVQSFHDISPGKLQVFYAGHSRGGISMQDLVKRVFDKGFGENMSSITQRVFLKKHKTDESHIRLRKYQNVGLILLSSGLQRKYRPDNLGSFLSHTPDYPLLTVGGNLDGLFRIFRVAEAHYHERYDPESPWKNHYHLVVDGASHMSFASLENVPIFVRFNDLKPELSENDGHKQISERIASFIARFGTEDESDISAKLDSFQHESDVYFKPILNSLEIEGSYHLKPPCNHLKEFDVRKINGQCWRGSTWAEITQSSVAELKDVQVHVKDAFWKVWLIPVHLPDILTKCPSPNKECILNVTTVTQATYEFIDLIDSGFTPVSAYELRIKMKSRQSLHDAAGIANASFTELDDNDLFCKKLNERALNYALTIADSHALKRYVEFGDQLRMSTDLGPYNAGPNWIWKPLKFNKRGSYENGKWYVDVNSPTMRTPIDYPIKSAAGFHYCKLLSPARALEWIYLDSLKRKFSY